MSDALKNLTVAALKELARRQLGKGFSRLKTKAELVAALAAQASAKSAPSNVNGAAAAVATSARPTPSKRAEVTRFEKPASSNGHGVTAASAPPVSRPSPPPPPVSEGFFVVRVAGSVEAERHHLTESSGAPPTPTPPAAGYDEQLGELPDGYEDDAVLLLPRDPHTLFFLWDFARQTRQSALAGLEHPHAKLRVFDGEALVREVDFALESRSFYVHGLTPGRSYRVEACFVGNRGEVRRIGRTSNVIALPREGPSDDLTVRFMRIPWDLPLNRIRELLRQAREAQARVASPARMPLPSSQGSRAPVGAGEGASEAFAPRWVPSRSGRP